MLCIVDLLPYLHVVQCQRLDQHEDLEEQQVGETVKE